MRVQSNAQSLHKGIVMSAIVATPVEINARFENGVFVPEQKVQFEEHQRVTLRISPQTQQPENGDPRPASGVELIEWRSRHMIQIDPEIARDIAENPEFDIENS